MTKSIKFINSKTILLDGKLYRGHEVGELPKTFAFIYNEDKDQEGINSWFNYQGLTYIEYKPTIWSYV